MEIRDFDALWDYDRPGETEQRLRQLLPETVVDPAYGAELLTQIARTQGLQLAVRAKKAATCTKNWESVS